MAVSGTSIKGFTPTKSLYGVDIPATPKFILGDSRTFSVGDAVRLDTSGLLKRCASTDPAILGIVAGLYDQNGEVGVFSPRIAGQAITGATLTPDDTLATASDNSTNGAKKLTARVILDPAGVILFRNVSNGSLAQTNVGQFFNLSASNAGQIDQASASDTSGQLQLVELDPDGDGDVTKGLFRIVQSQLANNNTSYGSTAIITA